MGRREPQAIFSNIQAGGRLGRPWGLLVRAFFRLAARFRIGVPGSSKLDA